MNFVQKESKGDCQAAAMQSHFVKTMAVVADKHEREIHV
jgi:hypothetical protein